MTFFSLSDLLQSFFITKRDWFVVEERYCFTKQLCDAAFSEDFGFGIVLPNRYELTIEYTDNNSARLTDKEGQTVLIRQTVFQHFEAAQVYFEKLVKLCSSGDPYEKLYMWRIVARSRNHFASR